MRVACIVNGGWEIAAGYKDDYKGKHPKKDEIYTVVDIINEDGIRFYHLAEFPETIYDSNCFRKLDYDFVNDIIFKLNNNFILT